jgi:hypothetical protein
VLINLAATGRLADIFAALDIPWAIARTVEDEVVPRPTDPLVHRSTEPLSVDVALLTGAGLLEVLDCATDHEFSRFVAMVAPGADHLDDGEAMTFAIAIERGFAVATDDRKARRVLAAQAPQLVVHGTTCILHRWAETTNPDPAELARMLRAIQDRGRFIPRASDPDASWWNTALTGPGTPAASPHEASAPEGPHRVGLFDYIGVEPT